MTDNPKTGEIWEILVDGKKDKVLILHGEGGDYCPELYRVLIYWNEVSTNDDDLVPAIAWDIHKYERENFTKKITNKLTFINSKGKKSYLLINKILNNLQRAFA